MYGQVDEQVGGKNGWIVGVGKWMDVYGVHG